MFCMCICAFSLHQESPDRFNLETMNCSFLRWFYHIHNPFLPEIISCLHGVQMVLDFGINFLEMETDAVLVKQALMPNVFYMSEVGGLVTELKELLLLNA
jgi:hypothetical protein